MTNKFVKILVEIHKEDGSIKKSSYIMDSADVQSERGIRKHIDGDVCVSIEPNGDERLTIHAWKGCEDFETFEKEEVINVHEEELTNLNRERLRLITYKSLNKDVFPKKDQKRLNSITKRMDKLMPPLPFAELEEMEKQVKKLCTKSKALIDRINEEESN